MAKKVTYKEPAGYFTPSMRKVAEQWEKEQKEKAKKNNAGNKKKK